MWIRKEIQLSPRARGFHLITQDIERELPELQRLRVGLLHLFIKHSSASLAINENADPDVRRDFEAFFHQLVPENAPWCTHLDEGPDDMPAHIKAGLLGSSLSIPVSDGHLDLGLWQGIYLCEHRNRGGSRHIVLTLQGE
ncbi:secondary thiamine-phosphate synthase enzyme YjbQ [Marinobacterium rhizophilum]|uniref:Secondary thiamine-phosphate synthase enzyme YjbQ n=1 Tax=Marinobacterium rhizophilum TaxID=420402 RepID=A0ABY5HM68_9GAMM|nr:secondary thiamine-phosphate synthase enzyme YjbQ [Marinobacterium rhizophilum]UTW13501.1 secondary thiamine-phosphate synthase enzyme YjbQ [Marinobacterium rhizophilum]